MVSWVTREEVPLLSSHYVHQLLELCMLLMGPDKLMRNSGLVLDTQGTDGFPPYNIGEGVSLLLTILPSFQKFP